MSKINNETFRSYKHKTIAGVVTEIMFNDTKPNSVFVRNYGNSDVFVSTNSNPSINSYEQIIPSQALKSIVKIQPFTKLYFFSPAECILEIESFVTEDLRPADIPETEQIVFINNSPVTLGNINSINNPVQISGSAITLLTDIKSLLTQIEINTRKTT